MEAKPLTSSYVELYKSDFLLFERITLRLCIVTKQRGEHGERLLL